MSMRLAGLGHAVKSLNVAMFTRVAENVCQYIVESFGEIGDGE
jgi:hypothetical protein